MVGTSCVVFAFSSRPVPVRHPNVWHLNWIRLAIQYVASIALSADNTSHTWCLSIVLTAVYHPALLYYDYLLTFDRERRLFWSRHGFKQWGSLLFFLNRYCGVLGHVPVIIQTFSSPDSTLHRLCSHLSLYHQILAIVMQTTVGCMPLRMTSISQIQRLTSALDSYLHREDLCLVRQKPCGACRVSLFSARWHCDWWCES